MSAQKLGFWGENIDLSISQGRSFGPHRLSLLDGDTANPWPLTGCTFQGQVRKTADSPTVVASLTFAVVDEAGGLLDISLSDEATASIVAAESPDVLQSRYVWDAQIATTDGRLIPMAYGAVIVLRRVTRA